MPNLVHQLVYATGAAGFAGTWNFASAANATPLAAQYDEMRVLAGGIRVHPLLAATATPGIISSGLMPRCSIAEFIGFFQSGTPTAVTQLPYLQAHAKTADTDGIELSWRPQDNADFEMHELDSQWISITAGALSGASTGSHPDTQSPCLVIMLTGFPTGTSVFVESIFHLECTTSVETIASVVSPDTAQTLADQTSLPTFQSVFRSVASSLPSMTTVLSGVGSMASLAVTRAMSANTNRNTVWLPD